MIVYQNIRKFVILASCYKNFSIFSNLFLFYGLHLCFTLRGLHLWFLIFIIQHVPHVSFCIGERCATLKN